MGMLRIILPGLSQGRQIESYAQQTMDEGHKCQGVGP